MFRFRRSYLGAFFVCLVIVLINACTPTKVYLSCDLDPGSSVAAAAASIKAEVYVDRTPSMGGFVAIADSRYAKTLKHIEAAIQSSWPRDNATDFYVFGTESIKIDRNAYINQAAQNPGYYRYETNFEFNDIEKAIPQPVRERLVVIITDLYQENTDINKVVKALQERYLAQSSGYAVGILGIKSQFNGTIYDIGQNKGSFKYNSGNQPEQYHPFYVIMLGLYANVEKFFQNLQDLGSDYISDAQFVIFANRVVEQPSLLQLDGSKQFQSGKYYPQEPASLNDGKVFARIEPAHKPHMALFKVNDDTFNFKNNKNKELATPPNTSRPYTVTYSPLRHVLQADISATRVNLIANSFDRKSGVPAPSNDPRLGGAIELGDWQLNGRELSFTTKLNPEAMEPGVYQFVAETHVSRFEDQPWWREWSETETIITSKDGTKTYNLLEFMTQLRSTVVELANQPKFGHFCYAIQKD
jgi:hypothetical protein